LAWLGLAWGFSLSCVEVQGADGMSQIKSDERVVFFPSAARLSDDQQSWVVPIHGWIFEPEENDLLRGVMLRQLRDSLDLPPDAPTTRLFDERVRLFLVDNERGKRIGVRIAGEQRVLDPSGADGHFTGTILLPVASVKPFLNEDVLPYEAITSPQDGREFRGVSYCLRPEGISVISDIDDTVKLTEVRDKSQLIRNTFFREFRAVEGMPAAYTRWAESGCQFHFISASPWQLYEPLVAFLRDAGFPGGTMHLKRFRLKDRSFFQLLADPLEYKVSVIEPLLKAFPKRKFVLVGDGGEKDPEAYGTIARRYPSQIVRIYIRDTTGQPLDARRYQSAFRGLSADRWQVFREARELPDLVIHSIATDRRE
jgi:phosphatidate phosphatase APP1